MACQIMITILSKFSIHTIIDDNETILFVIYCKAFLIISLWMLPRTQNTLKIFLLNDVI